MYIFYGILVLFAMNILFSWEKMSFLMKIATIVMFGGLILAKIYLARNLKDPQEKSKREKRAYYATNIGMIIALAIATSEMIPDWNNLPFGMKAGLIMIDFLVPMMIIATLRIKKKTSQKTI